MRILGVLISEIESPFTQPLMNGILAAARQRGTRVVFLRGGLSGVNEVYERQFKISYHLADVARMDGVLVCAAVIQQHLGSEGVKRLVNSLPKVPMALLGLPISGIPAVCVDNYGGAFEVVSHLLIAHGCRRVAIITGPPGHDEAESRLKAWRDAHAARGMEADPALIFSGDFQHDSGRAAMQRLIESGIPFDAVFASNDDMAMGAMSVAQEAGYQIPGDARFVGFDDLLESANYGISLTTVNLPSFEMGMLGAKLVLDQMDGLAVAPMTLLKTRLARRHSCGCATDAKHPSLQAFIAPERRISHKEIQRDLKVAFEAALSSGDKEPFARAVTRATRDVLRTEGHAANLISLLLEFNTLLTRRLGELDKERLLAAAVWLEHALVDVLSNQELLNYRRYSNDHSEERNFRELLKQRTATFDVQKLLRSLTETLEGLDIDTCCIALYEGQGWIRSLSECFIPPRSRLIYAFVGRKQRPDLTGEAFDTGGMLPDSAWQALDPLTALSIHPVFHGEEHFGLIAFSLTGTSRRMLETIRAEVSSSLKASLLVSELAATRDLLKSDLDRAHEQHLTLAEIALIDELTGVMNRRGFLEKAGCLAERFREANLPVAMFFADIDCLKEINDHFGHADGDAAIRETANVLKNGFRNGDIIGRMGGDEFAVLATLAEPESLAAMRDRLYEAFEMTSRKYRFHLGCSIGYVICDPDASASLPDMLKRADDVLYEEKKRRKSASSSVSGIR